MLPNPPHPEPAPLLPLRQTPPRSSSSRLVISVIVGVAVTVGLALLVGLSIKQYQGLFLVAQQVDQINSKVESGAVSEEAGTDNDGRVLAIPSVEYMADCDWASMPSSFAVELDPLLQANGWSALGSGQATICSLIGNRRLYLVRDNDLFPADGQKTERPVEVLLLIDVDAGSVRELVRSDFVELYGASRIGQVLTWRPDSVTYEEKVLAGEGGLHCEDANPSETVALRRQTVGLDGSRLETEVCRLVDCAAGTMRCAVE